MAVRGGAAGVARTGRLQTARETAEQFGLGARGGEGDADPCGGLGDAGRDLDQAHAQGGELGGGEGLRSGDGVTHREHKPIGAGAQQHGHRARGGGVVDMDGQEAALVIVRVEQGELLMAMHDIDGVLITASDSEHAGAQDVIDAVRHPGGIAGVGDQRRECGCDPDAPFGRSQLGWSPPAGQLDKLGPTGRGTMA